MTEPEAKLRRTRRPRRPPPLSLEDTLLAVLAAVRRLDDAQCKLIAVVERLAGEQQRTVH